MEARIISTKSNPESVVVTVGYFSGEESIGQKVYYLQHDQTIEDIKPRIVDDLADFKAIIEKADALKTQENVKINLTGVKSFRETLAKERADRAAELEKAEQEKKDKAAGK